MKICGCCKENLPISLFGVQRRKLTNGETKEVRRTYCNPCRVKYQRVWEKKNPDKIKVHRRKVKLKARYGISQEEYITQLDEQKNLCAICYVYLDNVITHIDHNHITGNLRGILCPKCNKGIGLFADKPEVLRNAAKYLETDGIWLP